MHKSNKTLYKLNMNYSPFFYHLLNRTHTKKKSRINTSFNHSPLHENKYNFFPCYLFSLSHKSVTHKQPPSDLMFNAS